MAPEKKNFDDISLRQRRRRLKSFFNSRDVINTSNSSESVNKRARIVEHYIEAEETENNDVNIKRDNIENSGVQSENIASCESVFDEYGVSDAASEISIRLVDEIEPQSKVNYSSESEIPQSSSLKCDANCSLIFQNCLKDWLLNEKTVCYSSVDRLLLNLNQHLKFFPKSTKTLLSNSGYKNFCVSQMHSGHYVHFPNWHEQLVKLIEIKCSSTSDLDNSTSRPISNQQYPKTINMYVNIDGIPLYDNAHCKYTAYPLLVSCNEEHFSHKIFCAGVYCSNNYNDREMPPTDVLLKDLVSDFELLKAGVTSSAGFLKFELKAFICDAKARAALKNVFSHAAYNSCERCVQVGNKIDGVIVLSNLQAEARTDVSFCQRYDEAHHKSNEENILEKSGVKMVTSFILDVMHLCYLGIMKRILYRLLSPACKNKTVKLSSHAKNLFNEKLLLYQTFIPCEFNRTLEGGVKSALKWKASQFRLFALYVGCIVFKEKSIFPKPLFYNFLNFFISLRLMVTNNQSDNIELMQYLTIKFVEGAKIVYGPSFVSYNVHHFIHLVDDYKAYGNLEHNSAFKYESFLGTHIKGAVRSGNNPLHQIASHIIIQNSVFHEVETPVAFKKRLDCSHSQISMDCYKLLQTSSYTLKICNNSYKDSCIQLTDSSLCIIKAIHRKNDVVQLLVNKFQNVKPLFTKPVSSISIGVCVVSNLSNSCSPIFLTHVYSKMMILPWKKGSFVTIKLLNSD